MLRPRAPLTIAFGGVLLLATAVDTRAQYDESTAYVDWSASPATPTKRIEYVVSGPEDGEAILFIHGSFFADAFRPIMQEEVLSQYRKIRIHRLGYVGSDRRNYPISLVEEAATAVAVLDHLGIERAHVVGHSYGGSIAQDLAAYMPDRVATVVLAEGGLSPGGVARALGREAADLIAELGAPPPDPERAAGLMAISQAVQEEDWERSSELMAEWAVGENWREGFDLVPGGFEQSVVDAPDFFRYEWGQLPVILWGRYPPDFSWSSAPTLFLGGSETPGMRELIPFLRELMPSLEAVEIADADHGLIMDDPEAVAEAIADFIRRSR